MYQVNLCNPDCSYSCKCKEKVKYIIVPSSSVCYPSCYQPACPQPLCAPNLNNACPPNPPVVCNPCPNVNYVTGTPPAPQEITAVAPPAPDVLATYTPLRLFTGTPNSNVGGITYEPSNGRFTIPIAGRYTITAFVEFAPQPSAPAGNTINEVFIYRYSGGFPILLAAQIARTPSPTAHPTRITVTTVENLLAGDSIVIYVLVESTANGSVTVNSRTTINRLCYLNNC